jgi:hypothetical protein
MCVHILQRRTGIKSSDIDDFTRKASEVEAAIKGMLEGSVNPADVKIEGIDTPEEIAEKEVDVYFLPRKKLLCVNSNLCRLRN